MSVIQLFLTVSAFADVVHMERQELIQRSELIFVGEVIEKEARWNDLGSLIVTDYTFKVTQVLHGDHQDREIELRFAGGELPDGRGHSLSDVPEFHVGEVVVLMKEQSDWPLFSPVTGTYQGKFSRLDFEGQQIVVDGEGIPLVDENESLIPFNTFIDMVVAEIPVALASDLPDRSVPEELQHLVLKDLPALTYDANSGGLASQTRMPVTNDVASSPGTPDGQRDVKSDNADEQLDDPNARWAYEHRSKTVPVTFNPWPDSFPEAFRNHDQFALSYWNKYADIFRVQTATGSWAWQNGVYDMTGFPDNDTMVEQFGQGWGSSTLAVCWLAWDSTDFSIEADISCNPAFSWTTDDYATYRSSNLYNLDRTMTHEIGHGWGLEHQWEALSVMNYAPKKYRAYNVLYRDDISAVRSAFPDESVDSTDLGVALFFSSGFQDYDDSALDKTIVEAGDSLTVSDFVIENSGTTTVASPEIEWYLVPSINDWTGNIFVGTTTHGSLDPGAWFLTARTLTIPSGIPAGDYYLGAFVGTTDDIGDNDSSWLDRIITVEEPVDPPANDNWAGFSFNLPDSVAATNVAATEQADEQDLGPAGATVWWFALAPGDGTITFDTNGSNFDTMLHVYTGFENGFANLDLVASDDDGGDGNRSLVTFDVKQGQFYEIRVAGYNGATGDIVLSGEYTPCPQDIEVVGDELVIGGTGGPDAITVSESDGGLIVDFNDCYYEIDDAVSKIVINGGNGRDEITVLSSLETFITGGRGFDTIQGGTGRNEIRGGPGQDTIYGGPGVDIISGGLASDKIYGYEGEDELSGNEGSDQIFGGDDKDIIKGGVGIDTISGGFGNDELFGGEGLDTITGGPGNDILVGNRGNDVLEGGGGNDEFTGGEGSDFFDGGAGTDTAIDEGEAGEVSIENS
jgi:Ca2+-binding RTX toxin-like protein